MFATINYLKKQIVSILFKINILLIISVIMTGCGSLPSSGPSTYRIEKDAAQRKKGGFYEIIQVNQSVLDILNKIESRASSSGLSSLASPEPFKEKTESFSMKKLTKFSQRKRGTVQPGDILNVTIFSSGGLFAAPNINQTVGSLATEIPPQRVDESGTISVPFAGRIPVLGKTLDEIEDSIIAPLADKAIDPHVIVTTPDETQGKMVTVTGDVKSPKRIGVPFSGLRVLDAISAAGGSLHKAYETRVRVIRNQEKAEIILGEIYDNTTQNIFLQPGDTVVISGKPWAFTTAGALGQRTIPFESSDISLLQAVGAAGGLTDQQANPRGLFVFRFETPQTAEALGATSAVQTSAGVPVVYQFNLAIPEQMFAAAQFRIRNQDAIYAGSSGSVGLLKALGVFNALVGSLVGPAQTAVGTAAGFQILSN